MKIKKIINIVLIIIVLILLLIGLLMYKNTLASYKSKITGNAETQIADPIFVMENTQSQQLNDDNTEVNYYFNIKNFNERGEKTQTDLKYYIEIQPQVDSAISLTLYKDDIEVPLHNQRTDYIDLTKDANITHTYRLKVKYNRDNTTSTKDIKENIYIRASAIQS